MIVKPDLGCNKCGDKYPLLDYKCNTCSGCSGCCECASYKMKEKMIEEFQKKVEA